ncbi:hypothetical protein ACS0TY_035904 [Phlomoides rotata]
MSFTAGSSCFAHSPLRRPLFSTSSSQCSFFSLLCLRNAPARRRNATIMACIPQEDRSNSCARRAVLVLGFAVIQFLEMKAEAIDATAAENAESWAPNQKQDAKLSVQGSSSQNSFFSLLNALGFLGSGMLAAFYALTKKEKATLDATIESMKMKLKEKESAITSVEKKFEEELLNEKELQNKVLAKVNEEKQSLVNQLKLANDTIKSLVQEQQTVKRLIEKLTIQVDDLERNIDEAEEETRQVEQQFKQKLDSASVLQERINLLSSEIKDKEDSNGHLKSKLSDRERELDRLTSVYQQSENHLVILNSEIKQLKDVLTKNEEELELKNEMVHKLNAELTFSLAENSQLSRNFDAVLEDYNQFNSSMKMKAASDAKLLAEREEQIHLIEERLRTSLDETKKDEKLISDLTREKDNLKEMLNIESENVKNLEEELKISRDNLEKSRDEASDIDKQLQQSRHLFSELEAEIDKAQAESREAKESLQRNVDEGKQGLEVLVEELKSAHELLRKSNEELQITSQELVASMQKCDSIEKELVDARMKRERAAAEVNDEKKITSSMKEKIKDLDIQICKDKEARKSLESDLEETTKSLNEMNQNAMMLSKELEFANSQISSLEEDRDALYNSLDLQKGANVEAQRKLEDAHNLIMRLGKRRESLAEKGKRLDEELASAKGEILQLRSRITSSKAPLNNVQCEQKVNVGSKSSTSGREIFGEERTLVKSDPSHTKRTVRQSHPIPTFLIIITKEEEEEEEEEEGCKFGCQLMDFSPPFIEDVGISLLFLFSLSSGDLIPGKSDLDQASKNSSLHRLTARQATTSGQDYTTDWGYCASGSDH